jgi:hypothetical protein
MTVKRSAGYLDTSSLKKSSFLRLELSGRRVRHQSLLNRQDSAMTEKVVVSDRTGGE